MEREREQRRRRGVREGSKKKKEGAPSPPLFFFLVKKLKNREANGRAKTVFRRTKKTTLLSPREKPPFFDRSRPTCSTKRTVVSSCVLCQARASGYGYAFEAARTRPSFAARLLARDSRRDSTLPMEADRFAFLGPPGGPMVPPEANSGVTEAGDGRWKSRVRASGRTEGGERESESGTTSLPSSLSSSLSFFFCR